MRAALVLIAAVFLAHATAGRSSAAQEAAAPRDAARATTLELALRPDGTFAPHSASGRFALAGVQWRGSGRVQFRTRSLAGAWSTWRDAAPEGEDGPDAGIETRRRGWHLGNPWWVGASDGIEARARGRITRVRAVLVWSPANRVSLRTPAMTGTPAIVPRAGWNADESIRKGDPAYAPAVRFVIVHHTAGTNDYTRAQAPAIVRGIELYHVQANGWNDIGYNFLVDRFGTIYEGRYGGVDRNVVGAHALGFNSGSVGIAVLGTYGSTAPSRAAQDALARLIAWRLDLAHVDPTSTVSVISGGSERYPSGTPVQLRAVSGHRDTGLTECPGDQLYARLGAIAAQARALGGPKIFEPSAVASGPLVRIQARLSGALPWTVTITDSTGAEVAHGDGTGDAVDWTWDSSAASPGTYTWTVSAGTARPATGIVRAGGAATPFGIEDAAVAPTTISPNADGQADSATLSFRLTGRAAVTVELTDLSGAVVATLADAVPTTAGAHAVVIAGDSLADGSYDVVLTARPLSGVPAQSVFPLTVSRLLGLVSVSPTAFSPNGDGRNDELEVAFSLTAPASVRVVIEREGRWVATPFTGELAPGPQQIAWNGVRASGTVRDGSYSAVVEVQDAAGAISFGAPFTVDTTPPRVRFLSGPGIRIAVDEPAALAVRVDGVLVSRQVRRSGTIRIPWPGGFRRASVVASDAAGNRSARVVVIRRKAGRTGQ